MRSAMHELPHAFRDPALLELAFTHASSPHERDNERLEFLGDSALDLIVADELFRRHETMTEGELTEHKSTIVSRKTLAHAARALGLDRRAVLGGGMRGRTLPGSVLANLYEAVLGAIYLDGGYEAARAFVLQTLRGPIESVGQPALESNPKQALQHIAQARDGALPSYELLATRGTAHARAFLVRARVGEASFPSAWGRTRKEAERWAAHEALLVLAPGPAA
jgi:ribonuclease-3